MHLDTSIDLVGGGSLGFAISHTEDSHVYLVHDSDDAVLIDAGCGLDQSRILANVDASGVSRSSVRRIFITHAHADHAAGALGLSSELGAVIHASPPVADILRRGDEEAAGLVAGKRSGAYPPEVRLLPTPVTELADRQEFRVGALTLGVRSTPGHASGHLCFTVVVDGRLAVFSGDLVFSRGRVAVLATPDTDVAALAKSMRDVASWKPELLLPGHGSVVLSEAGDHLQMAVRRLDGEELPPPFLP
jgi:hydroxyacylglutathione hydrolase